MNWKRETVSPNSASKELQFREIAVSPIENLLEVLNAYAEDTDPHTPLPTGFHRLQRLIIVYQSQVRPKRKDTSYRSCV